MSDRFNVTAAVDPFPIRASHAAGSLARFGAAVLLGGSMMLVGCQAAKKLSADPFAGAEANADGPVRTLAPDDFVASTEQEAGQDQSGELSEPIGIESGPNVAQRQDGKTARESGESRIAPADLGPGDGEVGRAMYLTAARPGVQVTVSGLVGQVNGRPIYVDDVLTPIADQLAIMGREKSYEDFLLSAYQLIGGQLRTLVENQLLLAEMENELTPEQRVGLLHLIEEVQTRQVLQGGGSRAITQKRFIEQEGVTLEEYSDQFRRQFLIQEKVRKEIERKVIITWRDIEQYYKAHPEEFDPPASIQLRIIAVDRNNQDRIRLVNESLAQGNPFVYVAEQYTELLKSKAGLMDAINIKDDETLAKRQVTAWPKINQALVNLGEGEYAGPFDAGNLKMWVYVEHFSDGHPISLYDAQKDIEEKLHDRRFREESAKYFAKLLERGNYDDFEQMAQSLLAVALDRWAPEKTGIGASGVRR